MKNGGFVATSIRKLVVLTLTTSVSFHLHAQTTYQNTVTINFPDHRMWYTGCEIFQQTPTQLTTWCTSQYEYFENHTSLITDGTPPANVAVFAFDSSFSYVEGGSNSTCAYLSQTFVAPGQTYYVYQCGFDFIFHNGFEGQ